MKRLALLVVMGLALPATACAQSEGPNPDARGESSTVRVALEDFSVTPEPSEAPAGTVTFELTASGTHNFVLLRSDLDPDALPLTPEGAADTVNEEVVAYTPMFSGANELSVEVEPGPHILICNIVDHYRRGMRIGFTVA